MNAEGDDFGRSFLDFAPTPVRSAEVDCEDSGVGTRAYLLTGGRTGGGRAGVRLETMVSADGTPGCHRPLTPEQEAILGAARRQPMAVAEISARVGLVLGVAQVLIGDLVHEGLLTQSQTSTAVHDDVALIERMIARVVAL